jgi:hypothetical protein
MASRRNRVWVAGLSSGFGPRWTGQETAMLSTDCGADDRRDVCSAQTAVAGMDRRRQASDIAGFAQNFNLQAFEVLLVGGGDK